MTPMIDILNAAVELMIQATILAARFWEESANEA
jgi:hypothetical protein